MTYSLRRWQIYWGLAIPIRLDDSTTAGGAWHFCVGRLLLLRSKSGPGGYFYHYGLCELAQRQAVLLRKDKPSGRAIKSDRAKVVMTAGCISKNKPISRIKKPQNSCYTKFWGYFHLVRLARFERATPCLGGRCSIQLSYNRNRYSISNYLILSNSQIGVYTPSLS